MPRVASYAERETHYGIEEHRSAVGRNRKEGHQEGKEPETSQSAARTEGEEAQRSGRGGEAPGRKCGADELPRDDQKDGGEGLLGVPRRADATRYSLLGDPPGTEDEGHRG